MKFDFDSDAAFQLLRSAMFYDTRRRYEILKEEIVHFEAVIHYRTSRDAPESGTQSGGSGETDRSRTSDTNLLGQLRGAADKLRKECEADLEEEALFRAELEGDRKNPSSGSRSEHDCFGILWNAKAHEKALVLAERLGGLHDRLDQFLQRTNPDQPEATLRRRVEQGLTDKYLSTFVNWVHRDLVLFAESTRARVPYGTLPNTLQHWDYGRSSRQHSFTNLDEHVQWKQRVASYAARSGSPDKKDPGKFTAISLSYWIPERPTLIPIVGHELAHQVLRDLFGREINFPLIENHRSELARVYRRLTSAVEAWLARRIEQERLSVKLMSSMVQEILCDVLAAIRFGHAYAYAWVLEMASEERFAHLFHDEYGMLRRYRGGGTADDGESAYATSFPNLKKDVFAHASRLSRTTLDAYYRGRVIAGMLGRLPLEQDHYAQEFRSAMETMLDRMLDIYTHGDVERQAYERTLAEDLVSTVCDEWLSHDGGPGVGESNFLKQAREFWSLAGQRLTRITLARQVISGDFRNRIIAALETFDDPSAPIKDSTIFSNVSSVRTMTDVTWRLEWFLERHRARTNGPTPQHEQARVAVREINMIGMDDYLFRTADMTQVLAVLVDRQAADSNTLGKLVPYSHRLDEEALKRVYSDDNSFSVLDSIEAGKLMPGNGAYSVNWMDANIPLQQELLRFFPAELAKRRTTRERRQQDLGAKATGLNFLFGPSKSKTDGIWTLRMSRSRSKDGSQALDQSNNDHGDPALSLRVLGRYDSASLHCTYSTPEGGGAGDEKTTPALPTQHQGAPAAASLADPCSPASSVDPPTVVRKKRLVRLCGDLEPFKLDKSFRVLAVVMVSVKWEALRAIASSWLVSQEVKQTLVHSSLAVFLSDGWEDIVVLHGVSTSDGQPEQARGDWLDKAAEELVALVRLLNRNPFVAGTETLCTNEVLKVRSKRFRFRFLFRLGGSGFPDARANLIKLCRELGLDAFSLAGTKDFEALIREPRADEQPTKTPDQVHRALHEQSKGQFRVETRVAWQPLE